MIETVLDATVKEQIASKLPFAFKRDMLRTPFATVHDASLEQALTTIDCDEVNVKLGDMPAVTENTNTLSLRVVPVMFA
jgi:hypothetical protein